jgi:hypothetical protein
MLREEVMEVMENDFCLSRTRGPIICSFDNYVNALVQISKDSTMLYKSSS